MVYYVLNTCPGILGLGRPPGDGNGNQLKYSCLGNPMDREDWKFTVHGVPKVGFDLVNKQTTKIAYTISLTYMIAAK